MPVLPSIIQKIFSEETEFEAPASEAVMQKIGQTINGLIDTDLFATQLYLSPGSGNFIVPAGVEYIFVLGCGGGGGGGGGIAISNAVSGGGGGQGGSIFTLQMKVSPAQSIPYTVGVGGSGGGPSAGGVTGGNSLWNNFIIKGGLGGAVAGISGPLALGSLVANPGSAAVFERYLCGFGGGRSRVAFSSAPVGTVAVSEVGERSPFAEGGAAGTSTGLNDAGGGGGGGASLGAGGAGGNGTNGGTSPSGVAGTLGGGGGGGGGNGNAGGIAGSGGAGGNGAIIIAWPKAAF